jgi:hypothetical protein
VSHGVDLEPVGEQAAPVEPLDVVALNVLPSPQMLTSSSRMAETRSVP